MIDVNYLQSDERYLDLLKKISKESEAKINIKENVDSSLFKGPLIIHANEGNVKKIIDLLDDRVESVIIAFKDKTEFRLLSYFKLSIEKVFGFMDLSLDYEYNVPLLKNYLNMNYSKSVLGLEKLSKDLNKILELTQTELSRVKEMHDRVVKLRTENLKGAKVQIKFMAGEKSGGEFFDFIDGNGEIIAVTAGSDSYIASSMIISEVELLKAHSNPKSEIENFTKKILNIGEEYKAKVNYLITILNLRTLDLKYYQSGNSKLFFNKELRGVTGSGIMKLKRSEKLYFISEGAIKNWSLHNKDHELQDFLVRHLHLENKEFINEFFFELYRHKEGMFLTYDALMCAIEIDQNIIHEA